MLLCLRLASERTLPRTSRQEPVAKTKPTVVAHFTRDPLRVPGPKAQFYPSADSTREIFRCWRLGKFSKDKFRSSVGLDDLIFSRGESECCYHCPHSAAGTPVAHPCHPPLFPNLLLVLLVALYLSSFPASSAARCRLPSGRLLASFHSI